MLFEYKRSQKKLLFMIRSKYQIVFVGQAHPKTYKNIQELQFVKNRCRSFLDQIARYHISKKATTRWPMTIFFNIIDYACINACIIYSEITWKRLMGRKISLANTKVIRKKCAVILLRKAIRLFFHWGAKNLSPNFTKKEKNSIATI